MPEGCLRFLLFGIFMQAEEVGATGARSRCLPTPGRRDETV